MALRIPIRPSARSCQGCWCGGAGGRVGEGSDVFGGEMDPGILWLVSRKRMGVEVYKRQ